ncbi:MAG: hypothetical protein MRZ91_05765 [Christensenellaceae bacterium]|nr:hypothetical protein [Christensenellaceae bacterium]
MKKRILILFLILTTMFLGSFGVVACGKPSEDSSPSQSAAPEKPDDSNSSSSGNTSGNTPSKVSDSETSDSESTGGETSDSGYEEDPVPEPEPEPTPTYKSGEDAIMTGAKVTPDKVNPEYAIYYTLGQLANATSYESTGTGNSIAKGSVTTYNQTTGGHFVKNGDLYYSQSTSNSELVKVKHEALIKGDALSYRNDNGSITGSSRADYTKIYGVAPDKMLTGHIYNPETVTNAKLEKTENELYYFTFELDKDKAHTILKYQMKQFGGLSNYPSFTENTAVTLVINKQYRPVSLKYTSKYSVTKQFIFTVTMNCTETNEITFFSFNDNTTIPDESKFIGALNK